MLTGTLESPDGARSHDTSAQGHSLQCYSANSHSNAEAMETATTADVCPEFEAELKAVLVEADQSQTAELSELSAFLRHQFADCLL